MSPHVGVRLQRTAGTNPCSEVFLAEGARLQISSDLNSIHVYLFSSISCFLFIYFEGEGILPCQTLLLNSHYSPNHLSIFLHPIAELRGQLCALQLSWFSSTPIPEMLLSAAPPNPTGNHGILGRQRVSASEGGTHSPVCILSRVQGQRRAGAKQR